MDLRHGAAEPIHQEFSSVSPRGRIDNTPEAYRMATAEDPYRELEKHAKELGLDEVATHMGELAVEAGDKVAGRIAPTQETEISDREKLIDAVASKSGFEVYSNMTSRIRAKEDSTFAGRQPNGWTGLHNEAYAYPNGWYPADSPQPEITAQSSRVEAPGICEMVSVVESSQTQTVIYYETLTNDKKLRTIYADELGRPGNLVRAAFYLDKVLASQFLAAAKKDPAIIHQAVDRIMTEQILETDDWQKLRPPYDKWREAEGGVSRIAFMDRPGADNLDQAEIVEY